MLNSQLHSVFRSSLFVLIFFVFLFIFFVFSSLVLLFLFNSVFQPNHLIGLKQKYLKLSFANIADLTKVKRDVMRAVRVNREREKSNNFYTDMLATTLHMNQQDNSKQTLDHMDNILDIRYLSQCINYTYFYYLQLIFSVFFFLLNFFPLII